MRLPARLAALAALTASGATAGQPIVSSPAPGKVAVTVYRDPYGSGMLNLSWLNGYALISETRRVALPAGESELRFEGVAGGILPQSAIVSGLPDAVERNRDAYLLSPGTLLDRSLGQRVHLVRTSRATGRVVDQEAIVRSGADGAVVLETEGGFEALRCTGLAETVAYGRVPLGLSSRPTLSVRARSERALTADVTLSYLATGFDWRANYVATLSPGEDRLELRAWLTIASSDETSFVAAQTQAVAGRLNWSGERAPPSVSRPLTLDCWPQATTSDIPEQREEIIVSGSRMMAQGIGVAPPPPPPPAPMMAPAAMMAQQEALGALKLYRIPEPVTVAARAQKQVALLARPSVKVSLVYRQRIGLVTEGPIPARRVLVTRNLASAGLGLPLPAGQLALFSSAGPRPLLLGEGRMEDHAVGEDVELEIGIATGVTTRTRALAVTPAGGEFEIIVTTDRPRPIAFEAAIQLTPEQVSADLPLTRRNGMPTLAVMVPANSSRTLRFSHNRR
jgi:hypothetical protein